MIGGLSLKIYLHLKKTKKKIDQINVKMEKEMADCKILRDKKLSELSNVINRLFSAWMNAIATEEEVFNYINNIITKAMKPKINELLKYSQLKEEWNRRKITLLDEKIDLTAFFVWFIDNFPLSFHEMKEMHRNEF